MIRVYRYGLLAPHVNAAFVDEQMWLGHRYRNELTAIERCRRETVRQIERAAGDIPAMEARLRAAEQHTENVFKELKDARAKTRKRSETVQQTAALHAARASQAEASRDLRVARACVRLDPAIVEAKAVVNGTKDDVRGEKGGLVGRAKRGARAISGVGWGIYSRVEAQADAARKAIDKNGLYDGLLPNDPRFSRWHHEGLVGAQQLTDGGITVSETFSGEDSRVRIGPAVMVKQCWDPKASAHRSIPTEGVRNGNANGLRTLHIRLGKGETAKWASWPMRYHRPLPEDATIKEVVVFRKMRGPREEWYATITVDVANDARERATSGAVAVDLGWRLMEDGIRIGTWRGTDGATGEIKLSTNLVNALTKAASLRSIRDKNLDVMRDALVKWLDTAAIPAWFSDATSHLHQWKSQARMTKLVYRWATERFEGDEVAYALAEAWRYRDHHLWCYEEGARARSLRRRKLEYRVAAKQLAARYRTVVLEKFDLSEMAERPDTGTTADKGDDDAARAQRQLTAPSELRICLVHAFAEMVQVPAENTTRTCSECGVVHEFDAKAKVERSPPCPECGAVWDQDANAAINMLRSFERDGGIKKAAGARKGGNGNDSEPVGRSRFERARNAAAQRRSEQEAAREEAPKVAE